MFIWSNFFLSLSKNVESICSSGGRVCLDINQEARCDQKCWYEVWTGSWRVFWSVQSSVCKTVKNWLQVDKNVTIIYQPKQEDMSVHKESVKSFLCVSWPECLSSPLSVHRLVCGWVQPDGGDHPLLQVHLPPAPLHQRRHRLPQQHRLHGDAGALRQSQGSAIIIKSLMFLFLYFQFVNPGSVAKEFSHLPSDSLKDTNLIFITFSLNTDRRSNCVCWKLEVTFFETLTN